MYLAYKKPLVKSVTTNVTGTDITVVDTVCGGQSIPDDGGTPGDIGNVAIAGTGTALLVVPTTWFPNLVLLTLPMHGVLTLAPT